MSKPDNNTAFLPDFCSARAVFAVVLSAELLAIVLTLAQLPQQSNALYALALYSLFIQWIALTCSGLICLLRPYIERLPTALVAIICYLLAIAITLIISELAWRQLSPPGGIRSASQHVLFLCKSVGISAVVSALVLRYLYIQQQWRAQLRLQAEARFIALQARIRPHFLFNCMNTIAGLIRTQPANAEEAVHDLADLFRAILGDAVRLSTLAEERQLCEQYLRMEKLRLGDRLQVSWGIAARHDAVRLPALCLQPLIENAIRHGIEPLADGGCITIEGSDDGQDLRIQIANPVAKDLTALEQAGGKGNGDPYAGNNMAQANISSRLQALYRRKGLLQAKPGAADYVVVLIIPLAHEQTK